MFKNTIQYKFTTNMTEFFNCTVLRYKSNEPKKHMDAIYNLDNKFGDGPVFRSFSI
jgi:hypothetical protein